MANSQVALEAGVTVVLGAVWGDEGKGKLVDFLAQDVDIVCRFNGGNNADRVIVVDDVKYVLHLVPSGALNPNCKCIIGNGAVIHLPQLMQEIAKYDNIGLRDRLFISNRAHLVFDFHQMVDALIEQERNTIIGTTKKGIGPTYTSKHERNGIRICDLYAESGVLKEKLQCVIKSYQSRFPSLKVDIEAEVQKYEEIAEVIRPMVCDTVTYIHNAIGNKKKVIVEGAQAFMLDIDFGSYPYVTSSNCSAGGVCTGLGIPPRDVKRVHGAIMAYATKHGQGPFPTEMKDLNLVFRLRDYGNTTGRANRIGWFDAVVIRYSAMVNGFTSVALTKIDFLDTFDEIKIGVAYKLNGKVLESFPAQIEDLDKVDVEYVTMPGWKSSTAHAKLFEELPPNAQAYIKKVEEVIGIRIQWIGTGKSREDIFSLF